MLSYTSCLIRPRSTHRRSLFVSATLAFATLGAHGQQAVQSDKFVDSVGVNVHLHYTDTPYYTNFPLIKSSLVSLGVRHVRDGMIDTTLSAYYERHNELGAAGIKGLFIVSPSTTSSSIEAWPANVATSIEAYENPNELDSESNGIATLESFMPTLYDAAKQTTAGALPVLGPSLTKASSYTALGNISGLMDFGNLHNYFAGRNPGTGGWGNGGYGSIPYNMALASVVGASKPTITTETGYGNSSTTVNNVPESVSATYMPRLLLEQWNAGIKRTYIYELLSEGGAPFSDYGLLRSDGSQKPAFTAVANLLGLLTDPGAPFTPATFAYQVTGGDSSLHQLLLQKRDGSFYIALWVEKPSYDVNADTAIAVAPEQVTLQSPRLVSTATAYQFDTAGKVATSALPAGTSFPLTVTDKLMLVKLVTSANTEPLTLTVTPSAGGSVTSNPAVADWQFASGAPIVLTATPNPGYAFEGYSGDVTQYGASAALTMSGPKAVTATFQCTYAFPTSNLTLSAAATTNAAGLVTGSGCSVAPVSSGSWLSTTGQAGSLAVVASKNTGPARSGTIAVGTARLLVSQAGGNTVSPVLSSYVADSIIAIDGVSYQAGATVAWHPGDTHVLSVPSPQAVNGAVYLFQQWQAGLSGGASGSTAQTVVAAATPQKFSTILTKGSALNLSANSGGQIDVSSPGAIYESVRYYYTHDVIAVYAAANKGCHFVQWSGASTSTNAHIKVAMSTAQTLTAQFSCQ